MQDDEEDQEEKEQQHSSTSDTRDTTLDTCDHPQPKVTAKPHISLPQPLPLHPRPLPKTQDSPP
eukprot:241769-Rhodomonas_salina.1